MISCDHQFDIILCNSIMTSSSRSDRDLIPSRFRDISCSLGPPEKPKDSTAADMVSRRKILSRSRDDLNLEAFAVEEEDVWYSREKLFRVSYEIRGR